MAITGTINHPYPPALTDTSWKAAKTTGIRDKWNTELGAALRAAEAAYNHIDFDELVAQRFQATHGKLDTIPDALAAKARAETYYKVTVKPAIKILETAKSKAATASLNPVITSGARAKAGQMAAFLGSIITMLKSFKTTDYDHHIASLHSAYDLGLKSFSNAMNTALSGAHHFIEAVRNKPAAKIYNDGIEKAARDLTQCLGQVERMQKSGYDLHKPGPWAHALFTKLDDRANGRVKLPAKASTKVVLDAVNDFADVVDDAQEWWN